MNARQEIREQINARASDVTESIKGSTWRQLFIFPEGTTTNGKSLIKFKTGAFQVNKTEAERYKESAIRSKVLHAS